jgi:hypothetical protein
MKVLDRIVKWRNTDKDTLCDGLTVSNKCIELWAKTIDSKDSEALERETTYNYFKLKNIVWQTKIQPEALRCRTFFEDVRAVIEDQAERNKLKTVRRNLDIEKMKEIISLIDKFFVELSESYHTIYGKLRENPGQVTKSDIEDFFNYLLPRLHPLKDRVNILTQQVKGKLGCLIYSLVQHKNISKAMLSHDCI